MRALITGIRGAAGSYLAENLKAKGVEVLGIARPECNLLDFQAVSYKLQAARPHVIYHLAADADVRQAFDEPAAVFVNNTLATINLFEAVRKLKLDPLIMLCSSSEVYGSPERYPITEDFPICPSNPYAISKTAQDYFGQMYGKHYGMRVVITRAFSYVNPLRRDLALSNFARQIVAVERGEADEVRHGNLASIRTFCDVRDVAEAFAHAPDLPTIAKNGEGIYNIGGEEPVSIGEGLEMLIGLSTAKIKTRQDEALMRPTDVTNQIPDCTRFRLLTRWEPKIPLQESLAWLLDHYRRASC